MRQRGSTWQGRITLGGKAHAVSGVTRRDAERKLEALSEEFFSPTPRVTVSEWLATWQTESCRDWKPTTAERYQDIIRCHLAPSLGDMALASLTAADVAACLRACNRSAATRLKVYRVLHRALNVALYRGLIPANPCAATEAPRARRKPPLLWSNKELGDFINSLSPGRPGALLWPLLIGTGCRLGEALALRWKDYSAGFVTISATLSETRAGSSRTEPKTEAGYRRVQLPAGMRAVLDKQIGAPSAPIVVTKAGHSPARRLAARWLLTQCELAGVPAINLHTLRHIHASILIREGVPVTEVANRLGHASPAITTSVYGHLIRGSGEASVRAMDNALGGS